MKQATFLLSSVLVLVLALALPAGAATGDNSPNATPSAADAKAYFIEPKDKAELKSPVKVVFGLAGMGVAPAGTQVEHTGHHHLLIDKPAYDPNAPLPSSEQIVHFGKGQTEALLELKPGKHTLQLVLGDWKHQPHSPPVVSETITITVK